MGQRVNESAALSVRAAGTAVTTYRMGGTNAPLKRNPNCKVCNSRYRFDIEEKILGGASYKRIRDWLPEDAQISSDSMRRHWKNDMAIEQALVRQITENRAERVGKRIEDSVEALVDGMTYLEVVVQKGFDLIAQGKTEPTIKETLAAAKMLAELGEYDESALDQQAYVEAFSIYMESARRRMGDVEFAAFGDDLATNPVLAALIARSQGRSEPEPEPAAKPVKAVKAK